MAWALEEFMELVVDVTVDSVLGEFTQITLLWRVTFWELLSGGGTCSRGPPFVFSQEDLGMSRGNFSMFQFFVSEVLLAWDLLDSLEEEINKLQEIP